MKVLVVGWYGNFNLGDDLFIEAFESLFPEIEFDFVNKISLTSLAMVDAVFFGGGSFLHDPPLLLDSSYLSVLKTKKIFYLGVGVESYIDPIHLELMAIAQMIATRSQDQVERLKEINPRTAYYPDLVYSLQDQMKQGKIRDKSVLIMPNANLLPNNQDPHWKHIAWSYFKSEFAQFLDWLIEQEYKPLLFSMCQSKQLNDHWAATEIVSHLKYRHQRLLEEEWFPYFKDASRYISQFNMVITQRYHGIVLAEMTGTPYLNIHHHDKLKLHQGQSQSLSYYGLSKDSLIKAFSETIKIPKSTSIPVEPAIFTAFREEVLYLLK